MLYRFSIEKIIQTINESILSAEHIIKLIKEGDSS